MTTIGTTSVVDSAGFRSVFAAPEETLILVISDPHQGDRLVGVIDEVEELGKDGASVKLLVFGASSAILLEAKVEGDSRIGFLEPWARPLLPSALSTVDAVIVLGEQSETLLSEHRDAGGRMPILRGDVNVASLRTVLGHERPIRTGKAAPAPRAPGQYVLKNDWGIGDELLLSAAAREILRVHPGTEIWIRSRHGFRFPKYVRRDPPPADVPSVEMIYQNPTLYGPAGHSPFPGHLVQQMLDKFTLDTDMKVKALDVRPELDLRAGLPSQRTNGSILLHSRPNPRLSSKDWGIERWQKLSDILTAAGNQVRQVGGKDEPLLRGAEDLRGIPVSELPEIFAQSAAVVCVVGFLMHLAEATRTPAVVIYGGREHPAIDGYPDQVHLSSEPLRCRGRWGCHLAADVTCPHGMKCMEGITPERVAREVFSALAQEKEEGIR